MQDKSLLGTRCGLLFKHLTKSFPQIVKATNWFMVTDDEKAFFPPIKKYLPSMDLYRCTNHLDRDIEAALRN